MTVAFRNKIQLGLSIGLALIASACSSTEKGTTATETAAAPSSVTKSVAQREEAHAFSEIAFTKGSANLSAAAKQTLATLVATAESSGRSIDEAMVMAWADEELPSNKMGKLSKAQQELADKRTQAIRDYMKERRSGLDVDSYNMAKQPNIFQKWFNTDDARLKNAFVAAGLPTTADDLKAPRKAAHAVVLIKLND